MNPETYELVLTIIACVFSISFILTTYRIIVGPNSLDRLLSFDTTTAMLQCAFATYICWTLDTTVANAMLVIALLGFIATIAVSRFRKKDGAR